MQNWNNSNIWSEHHAGPAMVALQRMKFGLEVGFTEVWQQQIGQQKHNLSRQNLSKHQFNPQYKPQANPSHSRAMVPVPGSSEFDQWSKQFSGLANIDQPTISEAFAARVRSAVKRFNVISAHVLSQPKQQPDKLKILYR